MTDKISNYSTTPGSNNAASPDGWPEGMAPSGVNNSDREFAARVREWYEDSAWIDYGDTIVSSTSTTVSLSGDVTGQYVANRAIRAGQSDSSVGFVVASAYSAPNTSITVSGLDLTGVTQIELGAVKKYAVMPHLPKVRATSSASQTITAGTTTIMAFGTETYDTASMYDNTTYSMVTDTATAGFYQFNGNFTVSIASGSVGFAFPVLIIGGTGYAYGSLLRTDASDAKESGNMTLNCTAELSAGQTVTVGMYSGYAVNIQANGTAEANYFEARKVP